MSTVLTEQCAQSAEDAPSGDSPGCLFVSTSLATWTTANPEQFARDFQINDTVYRRLDPEYYAWLRSRMVVAKKAATAGHLPPAAFEELRVRFNAVHEWAVEHFGEDATAGGGANRSCRATTSRRWPRMKGREFLCRACANPPPMTSRQKRSPWSIRSASRRYRSAGSVEGCMPLAAAAFSTQIAASSAFLRPATGSAKSRSSPSRSFTRCRPRSAIDSTTPTWTNRG